MSRLTSLCSVALCLAVFGVEFSSAQVWNRYGPGTRTQASAVYDASTNQMFMFAGQHAPTNIDFNDVWALKNVISSTSNLNWVRLLVSGKAPSDRFGHTAVYNTSSDRMIVFGGGTGFPGPCVSEVWLLEHPNAVGGNPTWAQQTPSGTLPPVREGHVAVYDQTDNRMIVFGGTDCNGNYYNDLWILSNADGSTGTPEWTEVVPLGGGPSARSQATAIYDSTNNIMTVFGGYVGNKTAEADVWTLSDANGLTGTPTWAKLAPDGKAPVARWGHTAVYDSANNRMVVEGGATGAGSVKNDTWILEDANGLGGTPAWTQLNPTAAGPYRKSHTAIYDPVSDKMVIFGGDSQIPQTFTDDHVFVLTQANGLAPRRSEEK